MQLPFPSQLIENVVQRGSEEQAGLLAQPEPSGVHVWQAGHAIAQQIAFMQLPLAHAPASRHKPPLGTLQPPAPSQTMLPVQPGPWAPFVTGAHPPASPLQVWQVPQEAAQHTVPPLAPGSQLPLWHAIPASQERPFGVFSGASFPASWATLPPVPGWSLKSS
jgi:hypothetical protein